MIRDLGATPDDFQVIGSGVSVSHAFVNVTEFSIPVDIFGMHIKEDDFIHCDRNGAVIIPKALLGSIDKWINKIIEIENIIIEPTKNKNYTYEIFQKSWNEFQKRRV